MKSRELIVMILFQAGFVSLTGYGLGVGLCAMMIWIARARLPDYASTITYGNLLLAFGMVVVIAAAEADACAATLRAAGETVYTIGKIAAKGDTASVVVA